MRILPPSDTNNLAGFTKDIEGAIRGPFDAPVCLPAYATADLPDAAKYIYGFAYDSTTDYPKFSDGADWLSFSLSTHTHTGVYQPSDATLTALAAYNTNGLLTQTAADTFAGRTLTAPAAGFTITNPAGIAGNPTFVLANDLAALEALSGTNTIYYRSAADTWTAVTVSASLGFSGGTLGSALGTAAVQTYTEGTFTPVLAFGGASVGITYSVQAGTYTRIGRKVFVDVSVTLTNKGSSTGTATITGLPLTAVATYVSIGTMMGANLTTVAVPIAGVLPGSTSISLWDFTASAFTVLTNNDFTNTSQFYISFSYST